MWECHVYKGVQKSIINYDFVSVSLIQAQLPIALPIAFQINAPHQVYGVVVILLQAVSCVATKCGGHTKSGNSCYRSDVHCDLRNKEILTTVAENPTNIDVVAIL